MVRRGMTPSGEASRGEAGLRLVGHGKAWVSSGFKAWLGDARPAGARCGWAGHGFQQGEWCNSAFESLTSTHGTAALGQAVHGSVWPGKALAWVS